MTERLSTGIEVLDRKLGGGIPAGRVVVLSAAPASQSELLLYEFASNRKTVYLNTERAESTIRSVMEQTGAPDGVELHRVDDDDPLADTKRVVEELSEETTLIIDPMRLLEAQEESAYREFLNLLKTRTNETGSITFLHCLDGRGVSEQRDRTEYMADIIFYLSTEIRGETIENSLAVPKFRGGQALNEVIKLNLMAEVSIDVSRKIA